MKKQVSISRRKFLKSSAVAGGGLMIAFYIPSTFKKAFAAEAPAGKVYPPNAFIHIAPDDTITITINKLEMGQGVNTSMAQLIAEELDCDWTKIKSVSAPVDAVYNHTVFPMQMTGGSTALLTSWDQHRQIGASMREMLKTAAAQKWGVDVSSVRTENGFVVHKSKGKLSYGELSEAAGKLPIPTNAKAKDPKDFKIIGKSVQRVDAHDKATGKAIFGLDVRIPGMQYAMVERPPVPGAKLVSVDDSKAKKVPGVLRVVKFDGGVAVLAKNTFAARKGREALKTKWNTKGKEGFSDESLMADFKKQADKPGKIAAERGKTAEAVKAAKSTLKADYEFPYLAHAAMEPMNCTINFDGKKCEIWSGHQMPTGDRSAAAAVLGVKPESVMIHTVYAGGSFGRRANKNSDYVVEAAKIAKIVKKPLKVVWTREDDMAGGYFRPMNFHRVTLAFDDKNQLSAWDHHVVGQTVIGGSPFEAMMVKDGLEATVHEGVSDTHYEFANFRCMQTRPETPVTTLWWRSVGHTHTAYVMETMMDELAVKTNKDPLKLRQEMLKKSPRHLAVLKLLEKHWNGGKASTKGRALGLAVHESFNSVVGHVVEVSMDNGMPVVHNVWSAVDCGKVVNPEQAKTQVEGAIVYGLSAALYGEIKIEKGHITTSNFDNYPVVRMSQMPKVEVAFVDGAEKPTGLGEPGLPPLAPAVANAVYRLTEKRVRALPFHRMH